MEVLILLPFVAMEAYRKTLRKLKDLSRNDSHRRSPGDGIFHRH